MDLEDDHPSPEELESRPPTVEDLLDLCRQLNEKGADYMVIGGFAMRAAGYERATIDIDLLIDTSPENESKVFSALESLPDKAVSELKVGEVARYTVVRVADEIVVDLMKSAGGVQIEEALKDVVLMDVEGVTIPFASPRLLWRMKKNTHREKDASDLIFLQHLFEQDDR